METLQSQRLLQLAAGDVFSFDAGTDRGVVVLSGQVWITQEGDSADYVLAAGDTFTCDRAGVVVVEALTSAWFTVTATAAQAAHDVGYEAAWPVNEALFAGSAARRGTKGALEQYA